MKRSRANSGLMPGIDGYFPMVVMALYWLLVIHNLATYTHLYIMLYIFDRIMYAKYCSDLLFVCICICYD